MVYTHAVAAIRDHTSIAHLLIHEHSFIAVTVPMGERLAAPTGATWSEISD